MFGKISKFVAATVLSLGLFGSAALASSGSISHTGPFSYNSVVNNNNHQVSVTKVNTVSVSTATVQTSFSGGAVVLGNTLVGGVHTGSSGNSSNTNTIVVVHN